MVAALVGAVRRGRRLGLGVVMGMAVVLAACADAAGDEEVQGATDGQTAVGEAAGEGCRVDGLGDTEVTSFTGAAATDVAAAINGSTFRCAGTAVVAPAAEGWAAVVAAPVALAAGAPLLLATPDEDVPPAEAAAGLDPEEVVTVGLEVGSDGDGATAIEPVGAPALPVETRLGLAVIEHLDATAVLAAPIDDVAARAAAPGHLGDDRAVLPVPADPAVLAEAAGLLPGDVDVAVLASEPEIASALVDGLAAAGVDAAVVDSPLWPEEAARTAWLVDVRHTATAAVAGVVAAHRGDVVLPVDGRDLRSGRADTERLRRVGPGQVVLTGALTDDAEWQLRTVREGEPLPTGGFRLFEEERIVALYGHPGVASLGALGAQDLDATVERVRSVAAPYGADGRVVVPSFEIITTVASASPGPQGDYSGRTPMEELRPWVDRARDEGFYVILDLQPGRSDFLTQAEEYSELLAEPHVGLALDPEWRLLPDQVHLRQIGFVEAAEVQAVADWLAAFTRERRLPEKVLLLHQFRHSMLPDRDTIEAPPELAVVVHMDGHGTQDLKDGSYDAITAGAEDRWWWGWKNFYERDFPTASPERVLALDPRPVFVSYQ
jgi:hypothetical protein